MRFRKLFFLALFSFFVLISISMVSLADDYREVQASEILKQIENGEDVNLENCRIIGELNLSEIELENIPNPRYSDFMYRGYSKNTFESLGICVNLKVVESNLTIHNSIFENDLYFSNLLFKKSLSFKGNKFSRMVDFGGTYFTEKVDFSDTFFDDKVSFSSVVFEDSIIDFHNSSFFGDANFYEASFAGTPDFSDASFDSGASFAFAFFGDGSNFEQAIFKDSACFCETFFGNSANFFLASFIGYAAFSSASFIEDAKFHSSSFGDYASFTGTSFKGNSDFSCASFVGVANFIDASFEGYADFSDASFNSDVYFRRTKFKQIILNNTLFEEMDVSWSLLENTLVCDEYTYIKIIKNFRNRENFDDADNAYYQYRVYNLKNNDVSVTLTLTDIFMQYTCGFGVKPYRAFVFGGLIVLLFSFIFLGRPTISHRDGDDGFIQKVLPYIDWPNPGISRLVLDSDCTQKVSFWDAFYFSIVTFATIGYGDWYPKDNFRKWVAIEGFLGWTTLGLFLVTLTNVMIRP